MANPLLAWPLPPMRMSLLLQKRLKRGLSIRHVAACTGIDKSTLSRMERGQRLFADDLRRLARFYGCAMEDLLREEEK